MKPVIWHNSRCSKSRGTCELLENKNVQFEIRNYLIDRPTYHEIKKVIHLLNISPDELVRKNEKIYQENYAGKNISSSDWINILTDHPELIERPIVIYKDRAVIARPPERVFELISC